MTPAAADARGAALPEGFAEEEAAEEVVWRAAPEVVEVIMLLLLPVLDADDEPEAELEPVWVEARVFEAVEREREELGAPEVTVLESIEEADATVLELSMTKYGV